MTVAQTMTGRPTATCHQPPPATAERRPRTNGPYLAASGLLVVVLVAGDMTLSSQSTESALAWLAPVVNTAHAPSGVHSPCYRPVDDGCEVVGFRTASAGRRLLYLAGLAGVLAALALARDGERRLARRLGAAGLGAAVVAATLQIP